MIERDFKILTKIAGKQKELSDMVKEFKIGHHDDLIIINKKDFEPLRKLEL